MNTLRGLWPVAGALLVALGPGRVMAQSVSPSARAVRLLVRPRVGDTLFLQMEQTIEMSGQRVAYSAPVVGDGGSGDRRSTTRATGARPKSPEYGPRQARVTSRVTTLRLYAHSLVEASDLAVTTLLATTDSMSMWAGLSTTQGEPVALPLPPEGRQVRVRVTPDGAMRMTDPPPGAMELGATLTAMPALLPLGAVHVGETWERELTLPSLPLSGYRADGVVHARFRLDSLTKGGRNAWISMEGALRRDGAGRELPAGTRVVMSGTVRGTMTLDRERAWIVDARTIMDVQSEVAPGPAEATPPMLLDLRIVQRMRVR